MPMWTVSPGCDKNLKRQLRLPLSLRGGAVPDPQNGLETRTRWGALLRVLACLALVVGALAVADLSKIGGYLAQLSVRTVALMTGLHVIIILLTAWRFAQVAQAAGASLSTRAANRLTFASTLANMLLPTSLAGDAGRIWLVRRYGLSLKSAFAVGVFDRVVGLASLGLVVLLGALIAPAIVLLWWGVALVLVCLALVAGILLTSRSGQGIFANGAFSLPGLIGRSAALSMAAHLVSVLIAYVFLQGLAVPVEIGALAVLFPAVLLAASVPVSVGGWGTRELAAAAAFSTIGLDPAIAVAMAFMFGLTQTAAAGLGTALLSLPIIAKAKTHD